MANVTTELKVVVRSIGKGEIDKLSASLLKLGEKAVEPVNDDLKKSVTRLKTLSEQSKKTKNNVKGFSEAFKELANNLEFGSKEFKEATAEAKKLDAQLQKMEGRRSRARTGGAGLRAAGGVASTALGAGVFGGIEGFAGAIGGGILGTAFGQPVAGAVAGATAGAIAGNLRKQAGGVAELIAQYNSMKIALAGVSESQDDYNKSLQSVTKFSRDFLIPVDQAIGQYTRLKASVVGAGGSTEDTDKAFRGMAAAILATGGNVNDFNSALVATAQVFSKGKVSAEELRQQIGERLPGAFTIFADAMGISTRELDELLERGEVRLSSFGDFTEDLFARYGETSQVLGSAPEKAGQRLQVALTFAAIEYGGFFAKVGAGFQDYITNLLNFAVKNKQQLLKIVADFAAFSENVFLELKNAASNIARPFVAVFSLLDVQIENLMEQFKLLFEAAKAFGKLVLRTDAFDNFDLPPTGRPSVQERSSAILAQLQDLFGQFDPTSFGLGLRDGLSDLDGGPGGGGDKAAARAAAAREKQRLAFLKKINAEINRMNEAELKGIEAGRKIIEQIDEKGAAQIEKGEANLALLQAQLDGRLEEEQLAQKIKEIEESNLNDIQKQKQISILNQTAALKEQIKLREKDPLVKMRDDLDKLLDKTNQTAAAATAIGNAFSNAFTSIINGTKSADQAIADMLSSVAEHFMDMAAQIIAKQLAMIAYGLIMKALGVGLGSAPDAGDANAGTGFLPMISPGEAPYGTLPGEFAEGGYVSGPTRALIGEGGQGEYIIPESKMRESMARYSRGARGAAVIPEAGGSGTSGEGQAISGSNAIDVRYTVERINSVDYVTADQFQTGMQQAAAQGAKQGEQQTLKRLQMSGSTRKRLGM